MRASTAAYCLLALFAVAACDAKKMPAARVPACKADTEPGTVCRGKVDGKGNQKCIQPIDPTSGQCPAGLLQFLAQIVNVASASPADTCAETPCCDVDGQEVECVTAAVGCVADVKLCIGGGLGGLLGGILGDLDVQLGTVNLPIKLGGVGGVLDGVLDGVLGGK